MKKESAVDKWKAYNKEPQKVKKRRIKKDEVYERAVSKFEPISLPDEEIQSLFSEGILSKDINTIFNETFYVMSPLDKYLSPCFGDRAKNVGVLFAISLYGGPVLLFTEDYLIITCYSVNEINNRNEYKQTEMRPLVVPYDRINEIGIKTNKRKGYTEAIRVTKSGNPVVGAAVGGVLAGSTGAIIGAAATSKSKTQTLVPGQTYDKEEFYFYMYTKAGEISDRQLFTISNKNNKISDTRYNWTWAMNAVLTGRYGAEGKYQSKYIFDLYSETILGIVENGKRICRQKKILDILSSEYGCSISCQDHASERQFYDAICHEQELMSIKGFSKLVDKVNSEEKEKEQALGEMEEKIKELQSERAKLKLWDRKHKMELDNEIKQIKGLIKEINEEEITDISGDLIKLLGC